MLRRVKPVRRIACRAFSIFDEEKTTNIETMTAHGMTKIEARRLELKKWSLFNKLKPETLNERLEVFKGCRTLHVSFLEISEQKNQNPSKFSLLYLFVLFFQKIFLIQIYFVYSIYVHQS